MKDFDWFIVELKSRISIVDRRSRHLYRYDVNDTLAQIRERRTHRDQSFLRK